MGSYCTIFAIEDTELELLRNKTISELVLLDKFNMDLLEHWDNAVIAYYCGKQHHNIKVEVEACNFFNAPCTAKFFEGRYATVLDKKETLEFLKRKRIENIESVGIKLDVDISAWSFVAIWE